MASEKTVYTVQEVAEQLKVSKQFVYKMLRNGTLPGVQLGGRVWRVTAESLDRWVGLVN